VFDPERDDDHGARRFYLRLATIVAVALAACLVLFPSVSGFSAGLDGEKSCVAIADGWQADRGRMSAAEKATESIGFGSIISPEQGRAVDRANAKLVWAEGPGACVAESRHRLILSGIGLGAIALGCTGAAIVRRTRTNLRRAPAQLAGT
jgi:hypothetical protein